MIGLVITGHAHFATGMQSSLELITGLTENICYVDFPGDSTDKLKADQLAAMKSLASCDGVLVMCDLLGGSPFRNAVETSMECADQKIAVVAGANLGMLIEAASSMEDYEDPAAMADELIESAKDGIVRFEMVEREEEEEDEDGI